jgi:4-aminobutyrate aminotransferase-like enzyme
MQVNTYGGHPASAAVAVRNIEIMQEEKLVERSAEMGKYFMDGLKTLLKHEVVGDVRGKGLLLGVELVKNKKTKEQVSSADIGAMVGFARKHGVIIGRSGGGSRHNNTLTFSPPLVITRAEIDRVIDVLDRGLTELGPQMRA